MSGNFKKDSFNWVFGQISRHKDFLNGKDEELNELYSMCDTSDQRVLVEDLLDRFTYIDSKKYGALLNEMALYIKSLNYDADKLAIVSFAIDMYADSSQAVLQDLKVPICRVFDRKIMDCNRLSDIGNLYKKGFRHFIAVDEFSGTGDTVINRYKKFKSMKKMDGATLDFCVLAGMENAIDKIKSDGVPAKVFLILKKGISDYYEGDRLLSNRSEMQNLESKLAERIKETKLSTHSFGYKESESLYYKENGNIPNNVFPLFWWKEYSNKKTRKPLFIRVQNGY